MAYIQAAANASAAPHIKTLLALVERDASYDEMFQFGMKFFPQIRDSQTGIVNLDQLIGFKPEAVGYFHVLSELPSLPGSLRDLAIDFAVYADGEAVQMDQYYNQLNPQLELQKALDEISKRK